MRNPMLLSYFSSDQLEEAAHDKINPVFTVDETRGRSHARLPPISSVSCEEFAGQAPIQSEFLLKKDSHVLEMERPAIASINPLPPPLPRFPGNQKPGKTFLPPIKSAP